MSGRGGARSGGRGGRFGRGGGRSRGRGSNFASAGSSKQKGLCEALGSHVFDYGQKGSADKMRTSMEKFIQYVGTTFGEDIRNELENETTVVIDAPTLSDEIKERHEKRVTVLREAQENLQRVREKRVPVLEAAVKDGKDEEAEMKLALLQNEIAQAAYDMTLDIPIELTDEEKTQHSIAWRTYRERKNNLEKDRGKVFSLLHGQCMQLLEDRMKQDADWTATSTSYDPLTLWALIKKTILAQTEDQYPFATVYDQEMAFYSFRQDTLTNGQYYEKFNTKVDVGKVAFFSIRRYGHLLFIGECTKG